MRIERFRFTNERQRVLILIAGMPGAGKSSMALALGVEFGLPVIDKDVVLSAAGLIPVPCSADAETRHDRMAARDGLWSHSKGTSGRSGTAREWFVHFSPDTIELDTIRAVDEVVREAIAAVRL